MDFRIFHAVTMTCLVLSLSGCNKTDPGGSEPDPEILTFSPVRITLTETETGGLKELADEQLVFKDASGVEWVAPQGTLTDGASVPRLALWITDGRFDSAFLKAAIVHDAYCQEDNAARCPLQYRRKPWKDVHRMFYEACVAGGTSETTARIMFAGVWLGGPRWDDPDHDLGIVGDDVLRAGFDGAKQWIEDSNPTMDEIESWIDERESTVVEVSKLEAESHAALEKGDVAEADAAIQRSKTLLNERLKITPDDLMILNLKGDHHKNLGIKFRQLKMNDKAEKELKSAESAFRKMVSEDIPSPAGLDGLGGVLILRNDLDQAENFVQRALRLEPNYKMAQKDLNQIAKLKIGRKRNRKRRLK